MTPEAASPEAIAQLLQEPLLQAAQAGYGRPPGMTVEQYLAILVQHRMAEPATAGAYAALYQEVRYGGRAPDAAATAELCRQLSQEPAGMASLPAKQREALVAALAAPPAAPVMPPEPPPVPPTGQPPPLPPPLPMVAAVPAPPTEPPLRRGIDWPRPIVLLVLVFWSLAMIYVGFAQSRRIGHVVAEVRYRLLGPETVTPDPMTPMREFGMHRREAMSNSNDLEGFRRLARHALQLGRFHDAQVCYYYLIAREPGNAQAYNELAWLLLTADDPLFRDAPRALTLAERAYALAPLPFIADTLALAAYQNGDRERAIRLEQHALEHAASEEEREVYRQQLAVFQRGPYVPPEQAPPPDEATPTVPAAP
jgi:tetratricopeptide (TPR) repeat protein